MDQKTTIEELAALREKVEQYAKLRVEETQLLIEAKDRAGALERDLAALRELAEGQLRAYEDLHHTYVQVYDQRNRAEQDAARAWELLRGEHADCIYGAGEACSVCRALAAHEARVKGGAP